MSARRLYRGAANVLLVLCGINISGALVMAVFNHSGTAWRCGAAAVLSAIVAFIIDTEEVSR